MRKFFYAITGLLLAFSLEAQSWSIEVSTPGGFYSEAVSVEILCPEARIFYTTDGTAPLAGSASQQYKGPISIEHTSVLRILAIKGLEKSKILSHTYFIGEPASTFPVVSIAIPPEVLFHPSTGLFVKGPNVAEGSFKMPGANFWAKDEFPINAEIFETDGSCVVRQELGFRLFGGMSRLFPQKSFALVARDRYGDNRISYPVFGKKGLKKFKFLVFRNAGSDFGKAHFRDPFMSSLVKDWGLDMQDFRPAHVYINGKYWGIYNIREKINRYFLAAHHDVNKDSLDLLEHRYSRKRGSRREYLMLLDFLEKNSLRDPANYEWVDAQMDVENFMEYEIAQIFFDNQDAGGNIRYWKAKAPGSKWRWILYDTDWGFGLHDPAAHANNSLTFHTATDGPAWPNPPWSTFILRKLLENPDFQRTFINRFADHLNTSFSPLRVEQQIDSFQRLYEPEMPRHQERWNLNMARWYKEVGQLRTFARQRPEFVRMHLMEKFDTGRLRNLEIAVQEGGTVKLNDYVDLKPGAFSGAYFEKIPVRLQASPALGFRFAYWEVPGGKVASQSITLTLQDNPSKVRAVFERYQHPLEGKIIINEISCNNKASGDWIELYNISAETVQMAGWVIADSDNTFMFPNILLPTKGYMVVCQDVEKFLAVHPDAYRYVGNMGFGLHKRKEQISLYSADGSLIDSIGYDLPPSDSAFTLNLLLPSLNNGDPQNWDIQPGIGTPNAANVYYVQSTLLARQKVWIEMGAAAGVALLCIFLLIWRHWKRV